MQQEQRGGMGRERPGKDNKGASRKVKKKTKVLTTPVSDLVFRSSFTSPNPVGVERDREQAEDR